MPVSAAYAAVLVAALAHASWNALLKNSGDRVLMLSAIRLVGLVAGIVAAAIAPLPSRQSLPYLIGAAAIHYIYFALMISSYREGDMNQVYPIARGTAPLLVLLTGAWLAGEVFAPLSLLAVGVVSAGILLLASGATSGNCKAIILAVCTGMAIAGYSVLSGQRIRKSGVPVGLHSVARDFHRCGHGLLCLDPNPGGARRICRLALALQPGSGSAVGFRLRGRAVCHVGGADCVGGRPA